MRPGAYHALDSLLCCILLFPSMVFYWRGIWDLWGWFTDDKHWVMFGVGWCSILGYWIQPLVEKYIPRNNRIMYQVLIRVYLLIYSAFLMCFWRGVWEVVDHYYGFELKNNLITYFLIFGVLVLSRSIRTCIFPPMLAVDDMSPDVLKPSTRFRKQPYSFTYALDSVCSHCLLGLAIIAWRSMWNIMISFMFDDPFKTDVVSLMIGSILISLVYLLEEVFAKVTLWAYGRFGWWGKLIWEDLVYTLIMWCLGFLWIGGWNLLAAYVMPSIPEGAAGCYVIGTVLLMSLQQFGYVSTCGCAVDGADSGRLAFFPSYFLRRYVVPSKMVTFKVDGCVDGGHDNAVMEGDPDGWDQGGGSIRTIRHIEKQQGILYFNHNVDVIGNVTALPI